MDPPLVIKKVDYSVEFESVILSKVTGFWQKTENRKIITDEEKGLLRFSPRGRVAYTIKI